MIVTGIGRAVEPVDGEIAVTVGAFWEAGTVGAVGDRPSQAVNAIASANDANPLWMLVVW